MERTEFQREQRAELQVKAAVGAACDAVARLDEFVATLESIGRAEPGGKADLLMEACRRASSMLKTFVDEAPQ